MNSNCGSEDMMLLQNLQIFRISFLDSFLLFSNSMELIKEWPINPETNENNCFATNASFENSHIKYCGTKPLLLKLRS